MISRIISVLLSDHFYGKCLQVIKDFAMIKRGTVLLTEKPFAHALSSNFRETRCDNCYAEYELFRCSGCCYVKYCNQFCQKSSWRDHKKECSSLKRISPSREVPNSARLLARIILKLKRGGGCELGCYDTNKFRGFKDLMAHYSNVEKDEKRLEHATCLYHVLKDFVGEEYVPKFNEFLVIYGKMVINSFNILDGELSELGTGIYLGASTLDHSCEPNAVAVFNGTTINIRTLQDISDFNWSKVRISYIETLRPRIERIQELSARYYFNCDCLQCDKKSLRSLHENSAVCLQCKSPVFINQEEKSHCSTCEWIPTEELIDKYNDEIVFVKHQLELMKNVANLDACKLCLDKQNLSFHPHNLYLVKTLDLAFEASIKLQVWNDSVLFGPKLADGYELYYGSCHPVLGLHYLKYSKILLLMKSPSTALETLEKAEAILKVTHGEEHPLYRTSLSALIFEAKSLVHGS